MQVPEAPALFVQVEGLPDAVVGLPPLVLEIVDDIVGRFTVVVPGFPVCFAAALGPNPKQRLGSGSSTVLKDISSNPGLHISVYELCNWFRHAISRLTASVTVRNGSVSSPPSLETSAVSSTPMLGSAVTPRMCFCLSVEQAPASDCVTASSALTNGDSLRFISNPWPKCSQIRILESR